MRRLIRSQYSAEPIIKVNPRTRRKLPPEPKEWQAIYSRRSSIERLFGRLKCYRRLNNVTVRRKRKVTVHCFLSLIVVQAQALHSAMSNQVSSVRQCVHV
ncbi:transposase [Chloroflexota bacterium]